MDGGQEFLEYQQSIGEVGPKVLSRALLIDGLVAEQDSPQGENAVAVNSALARLYWDHTIRLLSDDEWSLAWRFAASSLAGATARSSRPGTRALSPSISSRVLVIGFGSAAPALMAAQTGCEVVWVERVQKYAELALVLATVHGLGSRLRVVCVPSWSRLASLTKDGGRFDAVLTEEVGDEPLSEALLGLALTARRLLLAPQGVFAPTRLRLCAMLLGIRTTAVAGFDLRGFNAFRNHVAQGYDAEHVAAVEGEGDAVALSQAVLLCEIDLNDEDELAAWMLPASTNGHLRASPPSQAAKPKPAARRPRQVVAVASAAGVLNCVSYWAELELPGGEWLRLGPPADGDGLGGPGVGRGSARPSERRARRQQLRFLGYERWVEAGEDVMLLFQVQGQGYEVHLHAPPPAATAAPSASASASASQLFRRWPSANLLAYHFPMIADEGRNGAFDRALVAAVRRFRAEHGGRQPRVLDIGSGSGLLAMMAARAGAAEVHSLEMVPALAAAAKHIVAQNGYAAAVTVHSVMSTALDPAAVGGAFDILVCEIVDNLLIGESVQTTVADARRRLLRPSADIIPRGGALWALAVEWLPPDRGGFDLSALHSLAVLPLVGHQPHESVKLQHQSGLVHRLAAPLKVFDFDWATGSFDALAATRSSPPLTMRVQRAGTLTSLVVYFTLDLDGEPSNVLSTGPDSPNIAWDQCARFLPVPLSVRPGDEVTVVGTHTDAYFQTLRLSGFSADMMKTSLGLPSLVGNPNARGLVVAMDAPAVAKREDL